MAASISSSRERPQIFYFLMPGPRLLPQPFRIRTSPFSAAFSRSSASFLPSFCILHPPSSTSLLISCASGKLRKLLFFIRNIQCFSDQHSVDADSLKMRMSSAVLMHFPRQNFIRRYKLSQMDGCRYVHLEIFRFRLLTPIISRTGCKCAPHLIFKYGASTRAESYRRGKAPGIRQAHGRPESRNQPETTDAPISFASPNHIRALVKSLRSTKSSRQMLFREVFLFPEKYGSVQAGNGCRPGCLIFFCNFLHKENLPPNQPFRRRPSNLTDK